MKQLNRHPLINRILWTLYMLLPSAAFTFVFVTDSSFFFAAIMIAAAVIWFVLSGYLFALTERFTDFLARRDHHALKPGFVFAGASLGAFMVLFLWLYAFFPGSYFQDTLEQYAQAVTGSYNDWHPVWHTLLFYTLPLRLTGGAVWSVVLFQVIVFSLFIGYMCAVLFKHSGLKLAVTSWIYIILNPYTGLVIVYPIKDIPFALAGAASMIMGAEIVCSRGEWSHDWFKCVILGFMLACSGIFRHNGIIFAVFLALALLIYAGIKYGWRIFFFFVLFTFLIKGPVYSMLEVEDNPQTVIQAVGLPMALIENVMISSPEKLDPETADFVYSIAPREEWEKHFELGNFGLVKYYSNADLDVIEEAGIGKIVRMACRCIVRAPGPSFKAIFELTDIVYGWDIKDQGYIGPQVMDNDLGIKADWHEPLGTILLTYYKIIRFHGYNFSRQSSFALVIMLTVILAISDLKKKDSWKRILVCLPVFAYDFGTMLLLTSADSRFFYITYLVVPAVMLIMLDGRKDTIAG